MCQALPGDARQETRARAEFVAMDVDGSGDIDPVEWENFLLRQLQHATDEECAAVLLDVVSAVKKRGKQRRPAQVLYLGMNAIFRT